MPSTPTRHESLGLHVRSRRPRPRDPAPPAAGGRLRWSRLLPLVLLAAAALTIIAMGWHRQLSLEALVRHRAAIDAFVARTGCTAWCRLSSASISPSVALSLPGAVFLTVAGGLFCSGR